MATYRILTSDEIPNAVKLWVQVFGVEAPFFETLLASGHEDDFSVGAFEGDRQVSSVHVFMRWFRDRDGNPLKVGGIGSVSTLPEARSQGHSSKLLQMAIAEMDARGCIWSYLGTGVNDHYARHGWRSFSTASIRGLLKTGQPSNTLSPEPVTVELLDTIAPLHQSYTLSRPLANARDKRHWDHAVKYRVTGKSDNLYLAKEGSNVVAYLVCRETPEQIELVEGASLSGKEAELTELIQTKLAESAAVGVRKVNALFPLDSREAEVVIACCEKAWPAEDRAWMGRPIGDRITWGDLGAILVDSSGRRSELDNF